MIVSCPSGLWNLVCAGKIYTHIILTQADLDNDLQKDLMILEMNSELVHIAVYARLMCVHCGQLKSALLLTTLCVHILRCERFLRQQGMQAHQTRKTAFNIKLHSLHMRFQPQLQLTCLQIVVIYMVSTIKLMILPISSLEVFPIISEAFLFVSYDTLNLDWASVIY